MAGWLAVLASAVAAAVYLAAFECGRGLDLKSDGGPGSDGGHQGKQTKQYIFVFPGPTDPKMAWRQESPDEFRAESFRQALKRLNVTDAAKNLASRAPVWRRVRTGSRMGSHIGEVESHGTPLLSGMLYGIPPLDWLDKIPLWRRRSG